MGDFSKVTEFSKYLFCHLQQQVLEMKWKTRNKSTKKQGECLNKGSHICMCIYMHHVGF